MKRTFAIRSISHAAAVIAACGLLAACKASAPAHASAPPPAPAPASAPAPAEAFSIPSSGAFSSEGTYYVAWRARPEPIPLNEPYGIEVVVLDGATRSIAQEGVSLAVDGRMPDHRHGMNREPRVRSLGGGRFVADGLLFHMPGYWELYFDVRRGIVTERAQVAVELE